MKTFLIGKKFNAILNGKERTFEVLEYDGTFYAIRWDDGEEEWASRHDLERWTEVFEARVTRRNFRVEMANMKPCYELDLTTRNRIIGLINQCEISNLGNVSFEYYERPKQDAMTFRMEQNNKGWELGVIGRWTNTRDFYKIVGDQIAYEYSEKDERERVYPR